MQETLSPRERALLISVYKGGKEEKELCLDHLEELEFLCETYHVDTAQKLPIHTRQYYASTFISEGKVEEILKIVEETKVNMVVFDDEIAPSQQRNLEKIFKVPVIDRTEVILGIFADRATTKEAKLQVELAEVRYLAPRLKRMWTHLSRQAATSGGGAYLKGAGEKQIEIDKRLLKDRITYLEKQIEEVRAHRATQRIARERSGIPTFALIGYTNVGKSTLLNALTQAGVFVEDKLFATLDTTTRKFLLPNNQEILLIDTVGFIRKLPHQLVAAFRSTLEEAVSADVLIHVIDSSHPAAAEQGKATLEVLKELGASGKPVITLLNKVDACKDPSRLTLLRLQHPKTIQVSATEKWGFDELQEQMIEELKAFRRHVTLKIPQSQYHLVSQAIRLGKVIRQDYEGDFVVLEAEIPHFILHTFDKFIQS